MEQQAMTTKEVVERTIDILNSIPVPLKYHDLITVPIQNCLHNLTMCIRAWEEEERREAEEAEKAEVVEEAETAEETKEDEDVTIETVKEKEHE